MAYIYNADIFCDSCGEKIKTDILATATAEDKVRFDDEREYDSDEFPKWAIDESETDSPQHCGSGEDCLECEVLPSGDKIGKLIGTSLTSDGIEYVREQIANSRSEVTDFWEQNFLYL